MESLQGTLLSWSDSIGHRFQYYRDIVQPIQSAALEMCYGIGLVIESAACENLPCASEQESLVACLLAYPRNTEDLRIPLLALKATVTGAASSAAVSDADLARTRLRRWVETLIILLQDRVMGLSAVQAEAAMALPKSRHASLDEIFTEFVEIWNQVKEEEERRAAEEAELVKTKLRTLQINSDDEVSKCRHMACLILHACNAGASRIVTCVPNPSAALRRRSIRTCFQRSMERRSVSFKRRREMSNGRGRMYQAHRLRSP